MVVMGMAVDHPPHWFTRYFINGLLKVPGSCCGKEAVENQYFLAQVHKSSITNGLSSRFMYGCIYTIINVFQFKMRGLERLAKANTSRCHQQNDK